MKKIASLFVFISFVLLTFSSESVKAQSKINQDSIRYKMQWFADAKLGIFIHYGIYAVNGIGESWSFYNKEISWPNYMKQLNGFTAKNYDPEMWADLIKESGARYSVLTTKHHDGVALWDTKEKTYNVVKNTPAQKDIIAPFFAALRKRNIKTGAYFSLLDWSHKDYPKFLRDSNRYEILSDTVRWNRFRQFLNHQLTELSNNYNPDLWWFDGDWEHSAAEWESTNIRASLLKRNPNTIINSRLRGYGDYDTPEQNFPISRPEFNWWELCMTSNDSWGFQPKDQHWKTPYEVISIFADVISNGGNLLLDIGPEADGTIPPQQVNILKELGKWNKKHAEAIFGTLGGIESGHFYGPTTLSKDSTIIYLFLQGKTNGELMIKGLDNKIESIEVVGNGTKLGHKIVGKISWSKIPGLVYIDVPSTVLDTYMTVLKVKLDKPIQLYNGKGGL